MLNNYDESSDVLEGFLCPICKDDLKTPERLTLHVENYHSEEQDLLTSLREIFSVAKKKIYKNIDETVDLAKNFDNSLKPNFLQPIKNYYPPPNEQEVGTFCDHISYFKAIRNPRIERFASDTNKLIIRIHKLLTNLPLDPNQRKQHEQNIVPWLEGKTVKLCPSCAKSFHLARRQHHCRLCGTIMCNDCSSFLEIQEALNLIGPSMPDVPKLAASDTKDREIEALRVCEHCLHLLDNRKEMQDSRTYRPKIIELYEKIQNVKKEILPEIPTYLKIVESLYEGDTIFTIADAGALRGKIARSAEMIEVISKAVTGIQSEVGSREESLKRAIRMECIRCIKEEILSIPPLPVEDVIKKVRLKRQQETEMMIERDRRLAREALEKYELGGTGPSISNNLPASSQSSTTRVAVASLDNWSGYQATSTRINDPLIEQINIIKGYIKQARLAMRFEEVATLEMNLRELQQEFYNRQQNNS